MLLFPDGWGCATAGVFFYLPLDTPSVSSLKNNFVRGAGERTAGRAGRITDPDVVLRMLRAHLHSSLCSLRAFCASAQRPAKLISNFNDIIEYAQNNVKRK